MGFQCTAKKTDGTICGNQAAHWWGSETDEKLRTYFCCEHFDRLVEGIFDLDEALEDARSERTHRELVQLYEEKTKRASRVIDRICSSIDLPKYEPRK